VCGSQDHGNAGRCAKPSVHLVLRSGSRACRGLVSSWSTRAVLPHASAFATGVDIRDGLREACVWDMSQKCCLSGGDPAADVGMSGLARRCMNGNTQAGIRRKRASASTWTRRSCGTAAAASMLSRFVAVACNARMPSLARSSDCCSHHEDSINPTITCNVWQAETPSRRLQRPHVATY
jgi:hypothetical protein